jgi:YHS domain-containing protein
MKIIARTLQMIAWLTVASMLASVAIAAEEPILVLSGNDPVELTQGKEVKGTEANQLTHGRYRYRFASAENKKTFQSAPERYGVQFDGACMKMGPLSGHGGPDRWFVAEGRIYLFASEGCRDGFMADPAAFTDRADAPPTGTEAEKQQGRELIQRALEGFGGAEKVDGLQSARWEVKTVYEQEGKKTEMLQATTVALPDRIRLDYAYGTFSEGHALANGRLVEVSGAGQVTPLPEDLRDFVKRRLYREPLAILRARNQPGFVAFAAGSGEVDGQKVDWINVGFAGATTKLGIEPKTGRVLAAVYRGRAPSKMGEVCRMYSDFKAVAGGVTVPHLWAVTYDGKPSGGTRPSSRTVALNIPIEPNLFPNAN